MANTLFQSYINPVSFREMDKTAVPKYVSRFMDDWLYADTIRSYQKNIGWAQPWQKSDNLRLQLISNYGPLTLKVFHIDGTAQGLVTVFDIKQQDYFNPGMYIRQVDVSLSTFEEGLYYLVVETGTDLVLVSDPQCIKEVQDNSLCIEYTSDGRHEGLYFDSPFNPSIRVIANITFDTPGARTTTYTNARYNHTLLKSVGFRNWNLEVGGSRGIPDFFIDKLSLILGCENTKFDGRFFSVAEGAEWSKEQLEYYPLSLWTIPMREKINREAIQYENETQIIGTNNMMVVLNTKGFGVDDDGGDFKEIIDVE